MLIRLRWSGLQELNAVQEERDHRGWPWQSLISVFVWGTSFAVVRTAMDALTPAGVVGARLMIGSLGLIAFLRWRGMSLWPERRDVGRCVFLGVVLAIHLLIQAYGLMYTSAINTGWIIAFVPVSLALGAFLVLGHRMAGVGWLGVLVATGGVFYVMGGKLEQFENATFGDMLQLSSCVTWTIYTLTAASVVMRNGALRVTTFAMATASLTALGLGCFTGLVQGAVTGRTLADVLFLGLCCSSLAYVMWFIAQREHGPTRAGSMVYFQPFITIAAAAAILNEPVTERANVGGVIVLGGVYLVGVGSRRMRTK